MRKLHKKFWFWAVVQAGVVFLLLIWRFYVSTASYLTHPTNDDMYAHTWSFQTVVFCIFRLFPSFVGLSVLVILERLILRSISGERKMGGEKPPLAAP